MMLELVKSDVEARINELLARANGRRRVRVMSLDQVRDVAQRAREYGAAWNDGGSVRYSYNYPASTTLALVKQCGEDNMSLAIGITQAPAICSSPGRAWNVLQPWTIYGPAGDTEAKWGHWITQRGIIIIDGIECDAFLE